MPLLDQRDERIDAVFVELGGTHPLIRQEKGGDFVVMGADPPQSAVPQQRIT